LSNSTPIATKYNPNKQLIIIAGPTAVGKTALSIELAQLYNCPILSFDSRQFYREMSIGTAKPNPKELAMAEHHFINSHSINQTYTSGKFELEALEKLEKIYQSHDVCLAVGGSGLYINALVYGIDAMPSDQATRAKWVAIHQSQGLIPLINFLTEKNPEVFEFIDKQNHARMIRAIEVIELSGQKFTDFRKNMAKARNFTPIWIGLDMEREILYERINQRVDLMIESGLEQEVEQLNSFKDHSALKTVGYAEFFQYFDQKITLDTTVDLIKRNSRRYAKRQFTWFKKNEDITWFSAEHKNRIASFTQQKINELKQQF